MERQSLLLQITSDASSPALLAAADSMVPPLLGTELPAADVLAMNVDTTLLPVKSTTVTTAHNTDLYNSQTHRSSIISYYKGVAVTLMINSPKWFQRRYSTMLSNVLINTPNDWAVQVFYSDSGQSQIGLDINPGIAKLNATHERLIFTKLPAEMTRSKGMKRRLLYLTDEWFWRNVLAERVLLFSGNGAMCSNANLSLLDGSAQSRLFDHVDYVGSPWRNFWGAGGDGSLSYRNRTAMLDAIRYHPNDKLETDGSYFIKTLRDLNQKLGRDVYRIATKEQTQLFAGLDNFDEESGPPMVISGTAPNLGYEPRELLLAMCPEIKVIFPALHDPNCFGAKPDGEKCAATICALKDKKDRIGGC